MFGGVPLVSRFVGVWSVVYNYQRISRKAS